MLEEIFMKKVLAYFLFTIMGVVLLGCNDTPKDIKDDDDGDKNPSYDYTQEFQVQIIKGLELFDSLYKTDCEPSGYIKKKTIFDASKVEELIITEVSLFQSHVKLENSFSKVENKINYLKHITYYHNRYVVNSYQVFDFSSYLSEEFVSDLVLINNEEVEAQVLLDKYGTHMVMSTNKGFYYNIDIEMQSELLTLHEMDELVSFLSTYKKDEVTEADYSAYEILLRKANLKLTIESNNQEEHYLDLIDKLNRKDYDYEMLLDFNGYLPIWRFVPKEYAKALEYLQVAFEQVVGENKE